MGSLNLIPVVDEGLGNSTYLLDLGDGCALVMDPERDLRQVRSEASRRGLSIAYAVETHLHADFISGVAELAGIEGATVLAPEVGPRGFAHTGLTDGQTVEMGRFTLQALHTPGHSPEHLSYVLLEDGDLAGIFTGGSLMVGTAGRTDLVSPDLTVPLARAQYRSLKRLMEFPDTTPVWPTHGAGSFCSAGGSGDRVTTIGAERATNPLLQVDGEDAFVDALLGTLGTFSEYFLRLGEINRRGPAVLRVESGLTPLSGAAVLDIRQSGEYAAGHVPGAVNIELGYLADNLAGAPAGPVIVMCGHGERAMGGASILAASGRTGIAVFNGGPADWASAAGRDVETGTDMAVTK